MRTGRMGDCGEHKGCAVAVEAGDVLGQVGWFAA
jgi:hypothetical protein